MALAATQEKLHGALSESALLSNFLFDVNVQKPFLKLSPHF